MFGDGKWGWGGKTFRANLGGKRTMECTSKTSFGGLREWDWSGLCSFPLRKMTGRGQTGRKRIIGGRGGGSKTVFGEGFVVCSPLLRVFHPPLPLPDVQHVGHIRAKPECTKIARRHSQAISLQTLVSQRISAMGINQSWRNFSMAR